MITQRDYNEQARIYSGELERGVDSDVMAEIGFQPLEPLSDSSTDMPVEGVVSEAPETEVVEQSTPPPETEDVTATPDDDGTWEHEAYAEYLAQQERENPPRPQAPRAAKTGRRRNSSRRLTGRAALFAEGRGTDPDLM
jgi:hypothetical protein